MIYSDIFKIYPHKEDKPMKEPDYDLIAEERAERYQRALQHRLNTCGDRDYPAAYARQDIISLLQGDMDTEADEPHHHLEGIVDISEGEE